MSKTPFEIRLELLKMAKDMLEQDYCSEKERLQQIWQMEVDRSNLLKTSLPACPIFPPFPTASEVIEKAKTLNTFVSNV